jgi:hypothetical protein
MDPTRDNPIIRFTTFWWGLATFLGFALLLAVIWCFNRKTPPTLEDVMATARYATKAQIEHAQAANLTNEAIAAAIPLVARQLAAAKPAAVEMPSQVVPGSPAAAKLTATPAAEPPATNTAVEVPADPAVMEKDKPATPATDVPPP